MYKKSWIFLAITCLVAALIMVYINKKNEVYQVPFYNQVNFNSVNNNNSWEKFREEIGISESNSKIENFKLIVDKNNNIYSVKFDIVDKVNGEFEIYRYENCFSCELEEENQVRINRLTTDKYNRYEEIIKANEFFPKLDFIKQEMFFEDRGNEFILIHSSGSNDNIDIEGDYFTLENRNLNKIDNKEDYRYKGVNLQFYMNNLPTNFSSDDNTVTVFISNFTKEKLK